MRDEIDCALTPSINLVRNILLNAAGLDTPRAVATVLQIANLYPASAYASRRLNRMSLGRP